MDPSIPETGDMHVGQAATAALSRALMRTPDPGSWEESVALATIDEAREDERARLRETFADRRKSARRWWGSSGRARSF